MRHINYDKRRRNKLALIMSTLHSNNSNAAPYGRGLISALSPRGDNSELLGMR